MTLIVASCYTLVSTAIDTVLVLYYYTDFILYYMFLNGLELYFTTFYTLQYVLYRARVIFYYFILYYMFYTGLELYCYTDFILYYMFYTGLELYFTTLYFTICFILGLELYFTTLYFTIRFIQG